MPSPSVRNAQHKVRCGAIKNAYDINRHLSGMPQDMRGEVYGGNIAQHPRAEPDPGPKVVQQ